MNSYVYAIGTIVLTSSSQILIKWRMHSTFNDIPESLQDKIVFFAKVLVDPYIILSGVFVLLSAICWMIAMTKFELSTIYPMIVVGLMLTTSAVSIMLFNESVNMYKFFGALISILGIYVFYIGNK